MKIITKFIEGKSKLKKVHDDLSGLFGLLSRFFIFLYLFHFNLLVANSENIESEECIHLTLTDAISRALNSNRRLLDTIERLTNAQYGVDLANTEFHVQIVPSGRAGYVGGGKRGKGLSIGGGVDFNKKFSTGTLISVGPSIVKTGEHYFTDIRALISQPLLRGLGKEYQLSHLSNAKFVLRSAYRDLYSTQVQLIILTIQALYEVIKAEKSLNLHKESYERVKLFHQAAQLKEKIGLCDSLDVYRAEMELRHAEDGLTSALDRLQEVEDHIRELLVLPLNQPIQVELPLNYTPHRMDLEKAIEIAFDNRIEIDQSEDQRRESLRLSKIAKKNLLPELNLVLNYTNCGRDEIFTRSCTRHRESTWGFGFTTSADFYPAAERIAYEQSLLAVESAIRGIDQTKASIVLDVKKNMRLLNKALKRIHLQEDQIKIAQGELCLAKVKFDRGLSDNFHVIQAEKSLRAAKQAYWCALIDHIVGEYQFLAAIGLLIDKPNFFANAHTQKN